VIVIKSILSDKSCKRRLVTVLPESCLSRATLLTHRPVCLTASGLASAAFIASKLSKVVRYNPTNLVTVPIMPPGTLTPFALPALPPVLVPFEPRFSPNRSSILPPPLDFGAAPVPRTRPPEELKDAPEEDEDEEVLAESFAASAEAERMAERKAGGLAPRIEATVVVPLRMRKVGML
jgi:hypothetical protein